MYRLIGTQLKNNLFPLIRYDTGDLIKHDPKETCKCGRRARVIKAVLGRNDDYIVLDDNRKIGRLDHIFKDSLNISEAQFVQKEMGSSLLYIVRNKNYTYLDEQNIIKNVKEKLGDDFQLKIKYVDKIKKTLNGKLKQVVNLINA